MATYDQTVKEKPEPPSLSQSPWCAAAQQDGKRRVVGWKNGAPIREEDRVEILRKDREARQQYKAAHKKQRTGGQSQEQNTTNPLSGMPPTWQAFWGSVPTLDPTPAVKQFTKEHGGVKKPSKDKKDEGQDKEEEHDQAATEGECAKLEAELAKLKQGFQAKQQIIADWDVKVRKLQREDKEEEENTKKKIRQINDITYEKGMTKGKLFSSDQYFHFLEKDVVINHKKEMLSLSRSAALMETEISGKKNEMRETLKAIRDEQSEKAVSESGQ